MVDTPSGGKIVPSLHHDEFSTTDPEMGREYLGDVYGTKLQVQGVLDDEFCRVAHTHAGTFDIAETRLPADLHFDVDAPTRTLTINLLNVGQIEWDYNGTQGRAGPGDVFVAALPHVSCSVRTVHCDVRTVSLSLNLMHSTAGIPIDDVPPGRLRFTTHYPESQSAARGMKDAVENVTKSLKANDQFAAEHLVIGNAARLLATTALCTFPHLSDAIPFNACDATPTAARRAAAFIEENAHTDIGLADIAAVARVTPSTLNYAFLLHRGTSPMGYLCRMRMDRAHFDLLGADPTRGDTVAAIAARWGYINSSNFCSRYRDIYGVGPQDTLDT